MGRANGKLILLGEHAVVYGAPAIAVGIERGASAVATLAERPAIRIRGRGEAASGSELERALCALLERLHYTREETNFNMVVDLEAIPPQWLSRRPTSRSQSANRFLALAHTPYGPQFPPRSNPRTARVTFSRCSSSRQKFSYPTTNAPAALK